MYALLGSLALVAGLTLYPVTQQKAWATERGITPIVSWPVAYTLQTAAGLAAAYGVNMVWGTGPAIAAAAAAWMGVLAIATDLGSRKVPWEVPLYLIAPVGVVAFAFNYTIEGLIAFGAATLGVVGVPLVTRWLTRKGLGASDVRMLWAVTATCSWWIGQTWLLYALIGACVIQLLVRPVAHVMNLGEMVPTYPDREPIEGETPRTRRQLPFAPALGVSFAAFIAYGSYTGYGACLMWNVFGTCGA